jgi:hypothetical protein
MDPKPELRVFLREACVINPPPAELKPLDGGLLALFVPKVIELAIGGVASWLKKAGAEKTEQVSGSEFSTLYITDAEQRLHVNRQLGALIAVYGLFPDVGSPSTDPIVRKLAAAGLVPPATDTDIVFEAAIVPTSDQTAFFLETRYFEVKSFINGGRGDRVYVATLAVTTPGATAEGTAIAVGNVSLGRMEKGVLPIPNGPLGKHPRYRSNLMPWARITQEAKEIYDSDVKRMEAKNKPYMPVTFGLTLSQTEDGNKFLAALGELLEGAKAEAAKELASLVLPDARAKREKEEADAAEKLYQAEEDAKIAVLEAEKSLAGGSVEDKAVLEAKLAKAKRALELATRVRAAAGLPLLP